MSLASLIGIDKERYDQGNTFLSQDPYLQNFQGRAPITFNTSAPNVDMMYGGNTNIYGAPTNTGGGDGVNTLGSFNQKDNLFEIGPNTNMQPNVYDEFGKDGQVYNTSLGQRAKNLAGTIGNYGLRALATQAGTEGGAMLGGIIPGGGILTALLGAGAGGKFGFDMSGRGPTDPERIVANFYGNQGNQPMQYIDEEGNLVDSEMQGYNISSAFGQGIPAAIDKRLATIAATNKRRGYVSTALKNRQDRLMAEKAALAAAEAEQMANMKARDVAVLDDYFGGSGDTTGDRFDGADTREEYDSNPTGFSGSS
jgi:hypothetical protein